MRKQLWAFFFSIVLVSSFVSSCARRTIQKPTSGGLPTDPASQLAAQNPSGSGDTGIPSVPSKPGGKPRLPHPRPPSKPSLGPQTVTPPSLCAALRGNGPLITAHFSSMARVVENLGIFDGAAGGSSASITMFIYESMLLNPDLSGCATCQDPHVVALRLALLLKSVFAYFEVVEGSDEATSLSKLSEIFNGVRTEGLVNLFKKFPTEAPRDLTALVEFKTALETLLTSPDLHALINPEFVDFALHPPLGLEWYRLREAYRGIQEFGQFEATDPAIFFRPGIFSFKALARFFGRPANFYAGRGPFYDSGAMKAFLDRCAPESAGLGWFELTSKDPACHQMALDMMKSYRTQLVAAQDTISDSRLADPVGAHLHTAVSVAIFEKPEADLLRKVRTSYFSGTPASRQDVYSKFRVGYWSSSADQSLIDANKNQYPDAKTARRMTLGPVTWEAALTYSPAEPGLSRIQDIEGTSLASAAGWPDLHPTLTLKNMGCEKVIYFTRWRAEDALFGREVAGLLGMTDAESYAMYDLQNSKSAFALSLQAADGVWCTNWDDMGETQFERIENTCYNASLQSDSSPLSKNGFPVYANQSLKRTLGCGGTENLIPPLLSQPAAR